MNRSLAYPDTYPVCYPVPIHYDGPVFRALNKESYAFAAITTEIQQRLSTIESDHQVRILYAAEAGSRAWGFASPDSDYDIRFLYVRPPDWYLSIRRARDVIEIPIEDELDLSGWELRKALSLFRDSNPALYEWLVSPIGYRDHDLLGETLRTLAHSSYSLRGLACHYQRMAEKNYAKYIHGRNPVRLKKYFYVIRPLVMIRWMQTHEALPPIRLQRALADIPIPRDFHGALEILLARKQQASEQDEEPRVPVLDHWISQSIEQGRAYCEHATVRRPPVDILDALLRKSVLGD